jgi:haloalkane dehalogenase
MEHPAGVVDFTPDPILFPFESRWFDSSVGPVHYIDEGRGPTLLLLHGNPDWSFLYRKIVVGLRGEFRCVVPDYPGFGLSVHPTGYGYTPAEHARVVGELVDHLDLDGMVVMGQDWGGPIGMDVASRRPDRVRGLVMGNTWFWPDDSRMIRMFSIVMGSRPMQRLIRRRNFFVSPLMKRSLRAKVSEEEFAHYADVVPTADSREGIAVFPVEIMRSHPWLGELEERVSAELADKPVVLVFGRKDPALASDSIIGHWRTRFPDATYLDLPDAGHYIQEDAPDEIIAAIRAAFG